MLAYQLIFLLIGIIGILLGIYQYRKESFSTVLFTLWTLIWVLLIVFTFFPNLTTKIAHIFGLGRGLDVAYIVSIVLLFYIAFKLYNKIEKQQKRINELVSELAIKDNEE